MTGNAKHTGSARLDKLDPDECMRLISPGGVGRVAFTSPTGPVILPVNYVIDQGAVLFRTALGGPIDADLRTGVEGVDFKVAFEVDQIDSSTQEAWSVLIRGGAHRVTTQEGEVPAAGKDLRPWAGGERESYIRISPVEITGRRIEHGS